MSCNCVGSTHDSAALSLSALYRAAMEAGGLPGGMYLLGDEAYVASNWMLVPYSGQQLPPDKDCTNYYISLDRQTIERAFGTMVARFGILHRPLTCKTKRVPKLMGAIARMHNPTVKSKSTGNQDHRDGDTPFPHMQDECCEPEPGRRRELEVCPPREEIRQFVGERGLARPPHSPWGRSNFA